MMVCQVRTPKSFYFKHDMIQFTTKRKQIFYTVKVWDELGTRQSIIESGKYNGEKPESLISFLINGDANLEAQL